MNTENTNLFCMNCGRRLTADAQFCPSCGAEVVRSEQSEQPEHTDRYATQYAEDPAPYEQYEQFELYDTPRYAPPPSKPAVRGQEVPKSLYAIVLSLTLAGMIVVGVIGGMIIHFTRSGGEKVQTAQSESAELAQTAQTIQTTQSTQPAQTTTAATQKQEAQTEKQTKAAAKQTSAPKAAVTAKKTAKKTTTTQPQTAPQPSGDESAAAARAGKSNIVNGGYAVSDGEYIYSSCGTLTRRRADGGGEEKLLDTQVYYLNVSGGWLYFTSVDENNAVCRMRTDGSGYEVLCSKYSYELTLYGGRLYFSADMGGAGYEICRMDTDGGDFTVLAANRAWYMNICDDLIFFCDYNGDKYSLKSMALDGSGMQTLYASPCSDICAANGRVYFSADRDKRSLYSMAYDGSDLKKLRSGYTKHTNFTGGRLYFTDKDGNICSMNADGGDEETLKSPSGGASYLVFILPDNYFYMDNSGNMHNVQ